MYYKIVLKDKKLYSSGGKNPRFVKKGKIWALHEVERHLRMIMQFHGNLKVYENSKLEKAIFNEDTDNIFQKIKCKIEQEQVLKILKGK